MPLRTGIVALTFIVHHMCRLLATYRSAIDTVLSTAVTSGTITASQKSAVDTYLDGAQAACAILDLVTGY
jgi:hypothetical protein